MQLQTKRKRKERTIARSFRVSERAISALEEEASRENVSVSSVLNRYLIAFAEYDRYFRGLGLVKISAASFRRFFDLLSEEMAERLGTASGSDTPQSIMLAKFGALNVETAISYLRMLSEYGGIFELAEVDDRVPRVVTLLHMLGPKGSIFLTNYAKQIFEAAQAHPKITSTEHSVTILIGEADEAMYSL